MAVKKNARVPKKRSRVESIVQTSVKPPVNKMKKRKALVIAQEIKFARLLANNDKRVRDKMLKNLKKWLTVRSESSFAFTESDFMRLWKGLFYCMWMSDKPLIQEELAESLSNIVHCFDSMDTALLYTKCTLKTLATEWFGIDQYRLDKFQMLVRRIVRQMFEMCRRRTWDKQWTKGAALAIEHILTDPKTSLGFSLHITELYMEEMAKIGAQSIPPNLVTELLRPFAVHLATMTDDRQISHVVKHIFRYLMFQSDVGMDYMEKFEAWRSAGFPCGNINAMEKVELSSEDESEAEKESDEEEEEMEEERKSNEPRALDPRAGRVDVELPQLPFDPLAIVKLFKQYKFHPKSTAKTRKQIVRLIAEFSEIAQGVMPIGIKEVEVPRRKSRDTNPKKAAQRLLKFEKELYSDTIRRKRKKKQPVTFDNGDEGFENACTPFEPNEHEANGFHDEEDAQPVSDDDDDEPMETERATIAQTHRISQKSNKKNNKNNFTKSDPTDTLEKLKNNKKQKKRKFVENDDNVEIEKITDSNSPKIVKMKNKKSKTKKMLNAINSLNKKLMNRLSDEVAPVRAKKLRLSNDSTWDVSSTDDDTTRAVTTKFAKTADHSSAKATETKVTNVSSEKSANEETTVGKRPVVNPVITKSEDEKVLQTPTRTPPEASSGSSAVKRVKIMLRRNTAQHTSEYMLQLRRNPAIPYDASRKPPNGVLKPSPLPSPANPFYKKV